MFLTLALSSIPSTEILSVFQRSLSNDSNRNDSPSSSISGPVKLSCVNASRHAADTASLKSLSKSSLPVSRNSENCSPCRTSSQLPELIVLKTPSPPRKRKSCQIHAKWMTHTLTCAGSHFLEETQLTFIHFNPKLFHAVHTSVYFLVEVRN